MLFRWFVGLSIDEGVFDASTFSKNRRLLTHEVAQGFLSSLLGLPEVKGLMSAEPFSVGGTLLRAFASKRPYRSVLVILFLGVFEFSWDFFNQ